MLIPNIVYYFFNNYKYNSNGGDVMGLENLGKRIREERLNKGLTQEQLAEKVNISLNFMSLIENGKNMSVQTLVNLANALDVSIDYLLMENIPFYEDKILNQISQNLQLLNDDEKIYFLNMIKQYRLLIKTSST